MAAFNLLDLDNDVVPLLETEELAQPRADFTANYKNRRLVDGMYVDEATKFRAPLQHSTSNLDKPLQDDGSFSTMLAADFSKRPSQKGSSAFVSGIAQTEQARIKKNQLNEIRSTDLDEKAAVEDQMPGIPSSTPGFRSNAHLRSEEYWREVLGMEVEVTGPFKWVEHPGIQTCVGCAILSSAFILSIDTGRVSPALWLAEQLIMVFSAAELMVVLARRRSGVPFKTFEESLVIGLDCFVVFVCVLEKYGFALIAVLNPSFGLDRDSVPRTLLRMAALLRFVRLIRIVPALHELAHGVMDALQGLFWVMVFMFLLLYAIAILCTRLIGHSEINKVQHAVDPDDLASGTSSNVEEVQRMFQDIPTSMFFLFETMSSWTLVPLLPLFELTPWMRIFFVVFYIYAGWTLLAVMTGVVSFNMIALRAQIIREDDQRERDMKERSREVLMEVFMRANVDQSGELSHTEFENMLQSQEILDLLRNCTNIKVDDLEDLWNWLDDDENGSVSLDEFLAGFTWLNEPFKPKTLLRLQEKVTTVLILLSRRTENFIKSTFDDITKHVQPPLSKMAAVTEQVQMLETSVQSLRMRLWKAEATQVQMRHPQLFLTQASTVTLDEGAMDRVLGDSEPNRTARQDQDVDVSPYSVADLERSIGGQIEQIKRRLERIVPTENEAPPFGSQDSMRFAEGMYRGV